MYRRYWSIAGLVMVGAVLFCGTVPARAAEQMTKDAVLDEIVSGYNRINDLKATFVQKSTMPQGEVAVSVVMSFLAPHYMKADAQVSQGEAGTMRVVTIFDGHILWQENYQAGGAIQNVIKNKVDADSPAGAALISQFVPIAILNGLLEQYNVTGVTAAEGEQEKVLAMSLKPNVRLEMKKAIEGAGTPDVEAFIPEYVNFYWDGRNGFCRKIETLNAQQEVVATLEYSAVSVNSGITPDEFTYTPPEDVPVMDMAELMQQGGQEEDMVGQPFPDFELQDLEGSTVSLSGLKNRILIINFWAEWCPPCKKELPLVQKLSAVMADDPDVALLTVTTAEASAARDFVEKQGYTFPVLLDVDGGLAQACNVSSIPRTVVVGKDGTIAEVIVGYQDDFEQRILDMINTLKTQ